jgi:hypothetical protein
VFSCWPIEEVVLVHHSGLGEPLGLSFQTHPCLSHCWERGIWESIFSMTHCSGSFSMATMVLSQASWQISLCMFWENRRVCRCSCGKSMQPHQDWSDSLGIILVCYTMATLLQVHAHTVSFMKHPEILPGRKFKFSMKSNLPVKSTFKPGLKAQMASIQSCNFDCEKNVCSLGVSSLKSKNIWKFYEHIHP